MPTLPSLRSALSRAALSALALALLPATAQAASAPTGFRPFAPDSPWNLPLRADAPLHPRSAEWVRYLNASVATDGTWINSTSCGMPIYWADPDTPRVAVKLASSAYQDPALIRAWSSVPIPAGATAANCSDKNFAVMQRQPDGRIAAWEFWSATKGSTGVWTARWGGASSDVQADRGIASSLS